MPGAKKDTNVETRLSAARQAMEKRYGAGTIINTLGREDVETVSTGVLLLDAALGNGGLPRGRTVELFGAESSGKSTLALSVAAQFLARQEAVLYLDYEHSFSPEYAALNGIDANSPLFMWSQPNTAEEGIGITEAMLQEGLVGLVIFDSIAAMMTKKEMESDIEDILVAPLARVMSVAGRRLTPLADKANALVLFINHTRDTIGGYNPSGQVKTTTPGGRALKFYASVRIQTAEIKKLMGATIDLKTGKKAEKPQQVGTLHEAVVRKNKMAAPGKKALFVIRDGWGLCEQQSVLEAAEARNLVQRAGKFYTIPGVEGRPEGIESALYALRDNPDAYTQLRGKVAAELDVLVNSAPVLMEEESSSKINLMEAEA